MAPKGTSIEARKDSLTVQHISHDSPILPAEELSTLSDKLPPEQFNRVLEVWIRSTEAERASRSAREDKQLALHIEAVRRSDWLKFWHSICFIILILVVLLVALVAVLRGVADWRIYSALGSVIVALSVAARLTRAIPKTDRQS